jgi:hypothetical protein
MRERIRIELYIALQRLGMAELANEDFTVIYAALHEHSAALDLQAVVNSIDDTLDDGYILQLLRDYNKYGSVFAEETCKAS